MNYKESRDFINSLTGRGIVPGLDNITALCNELGNPQNALKIIHIAGTNGKGSTGAFITQILISAGYSVCRYVSPAVECYREIFQFNGIWINEDDYAECASEVKKAILILEEKGIYPTSFEAETALAFLYFKKKQCDYAVVECGMGGRLDATNVIDKPEIAVITHISMDHSSFLGDTLEKIAYEKSGIIKKNCRVVSSIQEGNVSEVIQDQCKRENAELIFSQTPEILSYNLNGTEFLYKGLRAKICQIGLYQADNAVLAIEAVKQLGVSEKAILDGLYKTCWKFRFEVTSKNPYWIYDGAHNPDGAYRLTESLDKYLYGKKLIYIVGIFKDKDYREIAKITAAAAKKIYTVKPPSDRGLDSGILAEEFLKYSADVYAAENIKSAVIKCENEECDAVVCFGSLSFLQMIKNEKELLDNGKMS